MTTIKERLTMSGIAGLAVLTVVTITIAAAGITEPGPFVLGNVAHYYSNLVGAIVGWVWMSVALTIQMFSDKDNDPILAASMFIVGLSLIFVFNTIVIGTFQSALMLQVIGYMMLIADGMAMGFYLYYLSPEQRKEFVKA